MKKSMLLACALVGALLPAVAGVAAAAEPVGRAGDVTVTREELATYVRESYHSELADLAADRRRQALVNQLVRRSLAAEGEKRGLDKDPLVQKTILQWKLQNYPDFFWAREAAAVTVSDEELWRLIEPRPQFLLSAIVLGLDEAGRAEAEEIAGLLAGGADFVTLARQRSFGRSAQEGGDFGWNEIPSKFVEEREGAVIRQTEVGAYTPPQETNIGWVIYWVRAKKTAEDVFAERKAAALKGVLPDRVTAAQVRRQQELRDKVKIVYPAEKAIPYAGAPLVVVDGYAVFADAIAQDSTRHDFGFKNISTPKQRLEKFVDAFVVVREMEKTGLDQDAELQRRLGVARTEVLSQQFLRSEIDQKIKVTDADLRAEYERYFVPELYELQVVIGADRARIEEAHRRILAGEDFGSVAETYSEPRLKQSKGRLALGPIVNYAEPVRAAIAALPDGGVSAVLPNGDGRWIVVKRIAGKVVAVPPFEDVAPSVRTRLELRRRTDLTKEYVDRYRRSLRISIDEAQLAGP